MKEYNGKIINYASSHPDRFWNDLSTHEKEAIITIALNTARDWNGKNEPQFIFPIFNCTAYYLPIIINLNKAYYNENVESDL